MSSNCLTTYTVVALFLVTFKSPLLGDTTTDITVPDFSFEDYVATSPFANQPEATPGVLFADWTATINNYQILQTRVSSLVSAGTADGTFFAQIDPGFGNEAESMETENPVATIDNNATYTLTVALGDQVGVPADQVTIELLSGTHVLSSSVISTSTLQADAGTFADYTTSFNTLAGNNVSWLNDDLSIEIIAKNTQSNSAAKSAIDNVRLVEDLVPEPSTWAMMFLGGAGLFFLARRRLMA